VKTIPQAMPKTELKTFQQ